MTAPRQAAVEASEGTADIDVDDAAILAPLEAEFGQVRSRERVRDLAEVFTHQREVDAMLDQMPEAFLELDTKFLEPSCGSGNFLVEILRRKLHLISARDMESQEAFEHAMLRAVASIYGVDISPENVTEARARLAHILLEHYQSDANTYEHTTAFTHAAASIIGANVVLADAVKDVHTIELCDWRPRDGFRFQRVWSFALVPPNERGLYWAEDEQDGAPIHYSEFGDTRRGRKLS